ncbi:DUF4268 domain-containing protein [Mucilaginibacter limnophilus]|uniref:DUF4268 domain-containing protein n=2 Tax=Mucilaginibacter limnophilus TaxID=1932778 RepID=A0A3S2VAY0_9SPHI|nr:DUF4268 domain-containing protein [Mucilaginibacter limnophilus]
MAPQPSAEGVKVNWINYRTGIKHLYFRMSTDNRSATIAIEYTQWDEGIRALFFEQLETFKTLFTAHMGEEWDWQPNYTDDYGKTICRVSFTLREASIFNRNDWPRLITFFKERITLLDEFWSTAQYSFELFK